MKSQQHIARTAVYGKGGAVAAAREQSVTAAITMLEQGGNAVDAGVAAAFVAGVMEPIETTLAGSGFLLVGMPGGDAHSVEFAPRAPLAATPDMFRIDHTRQFDRGLGVSIVEGDENVQGAKSAGVPATLAGLVQAHARFGSLPLATVLGPAIDVAHDGFRADPYFALEAVDSYAAIIADEGAMRLFLKDGLPPATAHLGSTTLGSPHVVVQTALGNTLERIAQEGVEVFYEGELGEQFLETHRQKGGILTRQDLLNVKPIIGAPRRLRYRDTEIYVPRSPSGGLTELQILNIWQAIDPEGTRRLDDPESIRLFAEASWHAFADRYHWLGDPDFVPVPEDALMSQAYAKHIAGFILGGEPPPRALASEGSAAETPWNYFASRAAHDPWPFQEQDAPVQWNPAGSSVQTAGTTHVCVTDAKGMSVSITHTAANHCGAKVVCERTGLLLDAAMGWFNALPNAANSIAGGKRPLANMGPALMHSSKGYTAVGAPGGRRIISAVVQVIQNLVDRGMNVEEAISAPRVDASGTHLLYSERMQSIVQHISPYFREDAKVHEQHQGYGYELARPSISSHDGDHAHAAIDPYSRGYAQSID